VTTIEELELREDLPWGLHDATLQSMHIEWLHHRLTLHLRVKVSDRQDLDRGARVTVSGLQWVVVDPVGPGALEHFDPALVGGYTIDSRPGVAREGLPAVPDSAFAHYFFVVERNAFIHLCARDAAFEWTDAAPREIP
jgi:hypothetical protein